MKIGILTHYQIYNHGAILQMLALSRVFKKMGHLPYTLTYHKNFDFVPPQQASYAKERKQWSSVFYYFKTYGLSGILFKLKTRKLFSSFLERHFQFAPLYHSQMDKVCIGSDEVFSLEKGINIMMYGHSVPCKNIFSYAGSFGQTTLPTIEERFCTQLLSSGFAYNLKAIGVRDRNSYEVVKGLCNREATILIDPVLLYGYEDELNVKNAPVPRAKYLLLYAYDTRFNASDEVEAVRTWARKQGLKIVSAGCYHAWADENIALNPLELLPLFKNAHCVVTDTFHGSVLSLITQKEFAVFVREGSNTHKVRYLLQSLEANEAEVADPNCLEKRFSKTLAWDKINRTIEKERKKALQYLENALK